MSRKINISVLLALALLFTSVDSYATPVTFEATTFGNGIVYDRQYSKDNNLYPITDSSSPFDFSAYPYQLLTSISYIRMYWTDDSYHADFFASNPNYWPYSNLILDGIDTGLHIGNWGQWGAVCLGAGGNFSNVLSKLQDDGKLSAAIYNSRLDIWSDGYLTFPSTVIQRLEISGELSLPVPEPTTMLLLGSGLVGLAGFRKKFRKS